MWLPVVAGPMQHHRTNAVVACGAAAGSTLRSTSIRRQEVYTVRYWQKRASLSLAVFALFIGLITVLSACGGGGSTTASGPIHLVFWGFNQQIADQAALWNKTHPNIQVTGIKEPSGPNQYYPKLLTAAKAGNGPDIALVEYQYIPTMVANGALVDLSKYGASSVQSQFVPSAWAQVTQGSAFYGYPQDTGPMGLFYNAKIFQQAGITAPPATWDEFAQDAVKIHHLGPNYYIVSFPPQSTGWIAGLMWQAGAQWFTEDTANQAWKVNINSAASKQVADYWQNLINQGLVSTVADFSNDWNAALDKGTIASWPSAVWGQGVIKGNAKDTSGQWKVAPLPQWTAGANASAMWGGSAISVVSDTKYPQQAEEFVKWYLTDSGSLNIGVNQIGWFPSNAAAQQQYSTATDPFYSGQDVDQVFTQAQIGPWQWPPDLTTVYNDMGNDFNSAVSNKTSFDAALDQLQTQVVNDLKSSGINVES